MTKQEFLDRFHVMEESDYLLIKEYVAKLDFDLSINTYDHFSFYFYGRMGINKDYYKMAIFPEYDLLVHYHYQDGKYRFTTPIGTLENVRLFLVFVFREFTKSEFGLDYIQDEYLEEVKKITWYPERLAEEPDHFEYIYDLNTFIDFAGKPLQKKRNNLNHFRTNHPNAYVKEYDSSYFDKALALADTWEKELHGDSDVVTIDIEYMRQIDHFQDVDDFVVIEDDKVIGFFGYTETSNTLVEHIEFTDHTKGVSEFILQFIATKYADDENIKYLSREEDLGIESLRRSKLSLRPSIIRKRYKYN